MGPVNVSTESGTLTDLGEGTGGSAPAGLVDLTTVRDLVDGPGTEEWPPEATGGVATEPNGSEEIPESVLDLDAYPSGAQGAVEAVLMVVEEPVDEITVASALGLTVERVRNVLTELAEEYAKAGRGFELRQVAGGWRMYSRAEYAPVVERFMVDGQTARLTQAALETLAIVAYRQPVSRSRVGAVRGVNVDGVMRTLVSRGLVEEDGQDPETGAVLYRTTRFFLHQIGLTGLDELPALAPFLPEVDVLEELGAGETA
jgi:segregation and condensation protein B